MPSSLTARRYAIAITVGGFATAAGSALLFGMSSPVTLIALVLLLVGLRVAARQIKKAADPTDL